MISAVIPALNEEKLLPECLESLKNQDYQGDYEIIVVDNGSIDDTREVASKYGVKVIFCPKKGVIYARQAGTYRASGGIITQADADTIYPHNWLTRIANHFSLHPESAALAGAYVYKDPLRWSKFEYFMRHLANVLGRLFPGKAILVSGANFAFCREAFLKVNGYDANALFPDQWGISRRLSRVGGGFLR